MKLDEELRARCTATVLDRLATALDGVLSDVEPDLARAATVDALLQHAAEVVVSRLGRQDPELVMRMTEAARAALRREWIGVYGHPYEQNT